jgi:hypothetical protein
MRPRPMIVLPSIKRVAFRAFRAFASPANTQLAVVLILALLGMITSLLILDMF